MTNDATTCDACGTRYAFTSYKDRCPVCCPQPARDDDSLDDQEPDGESGNVYQMVWRFWEKNRDTVSY
jgi:hypothetical protein